jgi:hypothetical membrane protein
VVSSSGAPLLLIGGWTVAAELQSEPLDPIMETISALAALDADHRWVMTSALIGVGLCHITTSLALRPVAVGGRVLLALGGIAGLFLAATPLPGEDADGAAHRVSATAAFLALSLWPALSWRRGIAVPWPIRPAVGAAASAVLLGLLAAFGFELAQDGAMVGLFERIAAAAQAVWPLAVVLGLRSSRRALASIR